MPHDGQRYPARYAGRDIGDGMVSRRTHRWHSFDWWYGHWGERDRCGSYRGDGTPENTCRGTRTRARRAAPRRLEYSAYLEARYGQAEAATRGHMLSPSGQRRGISPREAWFSGRGSTSSRHMSDELRDWFRDHGRNLSADEFRRASAGQ